MLNCYTNYGHCRRVAYLKQLQTARSFLPAGQGRILVMYGYHTTGPHHHSAQRHMAYKSSPDITAMQHTASHRKKLPVFETQYIIW